MVKKCICQVCGAEFEVANRAGAKYCPECRKTAYKKQKREYNHKERRISEAEKAAADSSSEILRIDREAAKLGMSYGHYVALKEERGKAMDKKSEKQTPKPEPVFTALEVAPDPITQRELDTLRVLVGRAVKAFAGIECATAADSYNLGQTFGLLTAAQMILEGDES